MPTPIPSYVLITPARNEEAFIEGTIQSVVAQTARPAKWIIVSDGSTDRTDEIVARYAQEHSWIELLRLSSREGRNFSAKVRCFAAGLERLTGVSYEVIGNLDADLTFEADLFELLMEKFAANPNLGVAGAPFTEGKGTYDFRFSSIEHVSGACQMFRRECYEMIGGYVGMTNGGIDVLAVLKARMRGWQTRSFPERVCFHHRAMGSSRYSIATTSFRLGQKDYMLGRHPIWQLMRAIYQMRRPPVVVGGVMLLAGYVWLALTGAKRTVPADVVEFQRREQMIRLKNAFGRVLKWNGALAGQKRAEVI